jgi:hypothetical protein
VKNGKRSCAVYCRPIAPNAGESKEIDDWLEGVSVAPASLPELKTRSPRSYGKAERVPEVTRLDLSEAIDIGVGARLGRWEHVSGSLSSCTELQETGSWESSL